MNHGFMQGIATVLAFAAFIAVCWWAYRPANRQRFESDARLPLDTDPIHSPVKENGR
ncbi:MAG: cytochrome [Moraxellaceae bacterium]|jgi:cytochrome c oxidase cbb3-type subunit 4|nr:cytochrome [Moraxellaceae bacterium]